MDTESVTTEIIDAPFIPKAVLIAYENGSGRNYLETRPILKSGLMGAAKPVTHSFINSLLSEYSQTYASIPSGPLPKNMLYCDPRSGKETYVWYNKPGKRYQAFVKELQIEDGEYPMPGVIYLVKDGNLYIFAYKDKKVTSKTVLYKGPFFNYYKGGRVCLGSSSVKLPANPTWTQMQECWEKLFWMSINSHLMSDNNPVKGNLTTILKESRLKDCFDNSVLIATNKKVKDLYGNI